MRTDGQTQYEADGRFQQFCERAQKLVIWLHLELIDLQPTLGKQTRTADKE